MSQRSLLHDFEEKLGAHFVEHAGWLTPAHFGDPAAEYRAAREQAVGIDLSHRTKVELRGKDRLSFLQNFCTNDVVQLPAWHGCEAFLTNAQAKIIAHFRLFKLPESLWLDAAPGLGPKIVQHLERFHITEEVEIRDRAAEYAHVHLTGPLLLERCDEESAKRMRALSDLQLYASQGERSELQVRRNDWLGQPGYDLVVADRPEWREAATWAGLEVFETMRVEAGTPEYGLDIDETNLPQEVNRNDRAISFTKGCYVGQETVARIRSYGHVNRLLVGLKLSEPKVVPAGTKLFQGGQEIGKITSCVLSPRVGTSIALGYVRRGHEQPGTALEIELEGRRLVAVVSSLPFA